MNKKLKGTYAQNVIVLLYMHRMYLFKCEMNDAQITVPPGLSVLHIRVMLYLTFRLTCNGLRNVP